MGRLLVAFTGKKNRVAVVKSAAALINKAVSELNEIQNDPRLNDRQRENFAVFDEKIADLVAQIKELGNSQGLWPKGLYLNLKADELMKNVDAFAGEVEITSAAMRLQLSHSSQRSSSSSGKSQIIFSKYQASQPLLSVVDDAKTPTKTTFQHGIKRDVQYEIFDDGVLLSDVLAQTGGDTDKARAAGGNNPINILQKEDIIDVSEDDDDDGNLSYVSSRLTTSSASSTSQPESPASSSLYNLPSLLGSVHSFGGTDHSRGYSLPISPGELPIIGAVYDSADLLAWRQGRDIV